MKRAETLQMRPKYAPGDVVTIRECSMYICGAPIEAMLICLKDWQIVEGDSYLVLEHVGGRTRVLHSSGMLGWVWMVQDVSLQHHMPLKGADR